MCNLLALIPVQCPSLDLDLDFSPSHLLAVGTGTQPAATARPLFFFKDPARAFLQDIFIGESLSYLNLMERQDRE